MKNTATTQKNTTADLSKLTVEQQKNIIYIVGQYEKLNRLRDAVAEK